MYSLHGASPAAPQKPETFMLSNEAQQSLPHDAQVALQQVDNLKYFLLSAPVDWQPDQLIRRFLLPTGDYVSCVLWNNLFHISGTDIVRCLAFRFQAFGRPVKNTKKFEEGIFSDLRNLKAGTDATLEEPKSPFLDFLYKNNCIRTQKKQKVFYWYSVPHDRLFLDALERDLKREKMGQEATTVAVSEPALSFEFDSSQSLYDQLTKAQQANSSSFSAHASTTYGQPTSPVLRTVDAMPPPQMVPSTMAVLSDDPANQAIYPQMPMSTALLQNMMKNEPDFGHLQYDRSGVSMGRMHQRHASMPTFIEYSPAPSFVSSQFEDYSTRGLSFEPLTPPQHSMGIGAEPAYIANEDTGLYTAIPDIGSSGAFNSIMQLPPSNFVHTNFPAGRTFPSSVYSVIEGSPTYKQRRRRSSIPPGMSNSIAPATAIMHGQSSGPQTQPGSYTVHKSSELRRSVSASVPPVIEDDETAHDSNGANSSYPSVVLPQKDLLPEGSRLGSPLPSLEEASEHYDLQFESPHENLTTSPRVDSAQNTEQKNTSATRAVRQASGPLRRARSATMMELGPYPQKSHSCPIPSCGRLFKRLEHLKRHVRTHTQERPYLCPYCNKAFSRSDNLAQHRRIHEAQQDGQPQGPSAEDNLENENHGSGSPEETSSPLDSNFMSDNLFNLGNMNPMPSSIPISSITGMLPPQMVAPQLLKQQI